MMEILEQTPERFLRHEPNPYRGDRFAIYELREGMPNTLLFWSHDEKSARIAWERIRKMPVERRKTDFIEW